MFRDILFYVDVRQRSYVCVNIVIHFALPGNTMKRWVMLFPILQILGCWKPKYPWSTTAFWEACSLVCMSASRVVDTIFMMLWFTCTSLVHLWTNWTASNRQKAISSKTTQFVIHLMISLKHHFPCWLHCEKFMYSPTPSPKSPDLFFFYEAAFSLSNVL